MDRVYIMVPVFNEAPNIPTLFGAFRELQSQLSGRLEVHYLLVDDGSSDDTVATARREAQGLDLTVLEHGVNRGPGAAFATACEGGAPRRDQQNPAHRRSPAPSAPA